MSGEINSAKEIAIEYAYNIKQNASQFASVGSTVSGGAQKNKPTDAMRTCFSNASATCKKLGTCLEQDAGKINLMAEEFEKWDNRAVQQYILNNE